MNVVSLCHFYNARFWNDSTDCEARPHLIGETQNAGLQVKGTVPGPLYGGGLSNGNPNTSATNTVMTFPLQRCHRHLVCTNEFTYCCCTSCCAAVHGGSLGGWVGGSGAVRAATAYTAVILMYTAGLPYPNAYINGGPVPCGGS